ncbi:DDE superfamily endonuclease [Nitrosomonas sp. Nm51]|nr:DDE superfamily endonuclease [Nitrosomonas sp. Nm51]
MLRMGEVNEVGHQAMQHMLTSETIDWHGFGEQTACETDALLGGSAAVLIIDESAFAKKGESSAGVSRQWNGRLGKVDNCQVGVFASLCQNSMAGLVDVRLYLPEHWVSDSGRCKKAAIPEGCWHVMDADQVKRFLSPGSDNLIVTRAGMRALKLKNESYFKALPVCKYAADPAHRGAFFRRIMRGFF